MEEATREGRGGEGDRRGQREEIVMRGIDSMCCNGIMRGRGG